MVNAMSLQVKESENGNEGSVLWLDEKQLRCVESYEIKNSDMGKEWAELSIKMLVRFPAKKEEVG